MFTRLMLVALIATTAACQGNGTFFAAAVDGGGFCCGGGFGGFSGGGFGGGGFGGGGFGGSSGFGFDASFDAGSSRDGGTNAPWVSPFPNMGAPGFGTSSDTLCAEVGIDGNAIDVWSDERGVLALVTGIGHTTGDSDGGFNVCERDGCPLERLLQHDGTGWTLLHEEVFDQQVGSNSVGLRGVPNGRLFAYRDLVATSTRNRCSITSYDNGSSSCMRELGQVRSLFVVGATRAYAIQTDAANTRLLRFDGSDWNDDLTVSGLPSDAIWADESQVLVLDSSEPFRVRQSPDDVQWNSLGGPLTERGTAHRARDADDVWVGTDAGAIWHFDGQAWQQIGPLGGVTCGAITPVQGIWGSGDSIYFYSATAVQRWNGTSLESLANWTCAFNGTFTEIHDLWGNSDDEVFVALSGGPSDACGRAIVVRFDGTQFHRM